MALRWIAIEALEALGPRRGGGSAPASSPEGMIVVMSLLMLVMLAVVGGTLAWALRRIQAFRGALGASIRALGLVPTGWMRGLAAQGQLGGRPIEIRTLPDARRVPSMLQVNLTARTARSVVVGPARGAFAGLVGGLFSGLAGRSEVPLGGPFADRCVTADEPGAAAALLQGPAGELALRLTTPASSGQVRFVKIEPGAVRLVISGYVLSTATPAALKGWVADLCALADLAER